MMTAHETSTLQSAVSDPAPGLTRRALLKVGGTAGVALATGGTAFASIKRKRFIAKSHLRRSSYLALVGQRFATPGATGGLRLIRVEDLNAHQKGSQNAFALIFRESHGARALKHPTSQLHHSSLGTFPLFMVPGPASPSGQTYCAVINRLHA
jgi:hypothetical protein